MVTAHPRTENFDDWPDGTPGEEADDASTARITLRLPESLKARIDAAANAANLSVNSWLVQAAQRAMADPGSAGSRRSGPFIGQRFTGYARS